MIQPSPVPCVNCETKASHPLARAAPPAAALKPGRLPRCLSGKMTAAAASMFPARLLTACLAGKPVPQPAAQNNTRPDPAKIHVTLKQVAQLQRQSSHATDRSHWIPCQRKKAACAAQQTSKQASPAMLSRRPCLVAALPQIAIQMRHARPSVAGATCKLVCKATIWPRHASRGRLARDVVTHHTSCSLLKRGHNSCSLAVTQHRMDHTFALHPQLSATFTTPAAARRYDHQGR